MSRTRLVGLMLLVGVLSATAHPVSSSAADAYVVHAEGGVVATGWLAGLPFPDGSSRTFEVMLVVPEGATTSSATAPGAVDLARPWVVVTEFLNHDAAYENAGKVVCSTAANPTSWNRGGLDFSQHATGAWTGMYVDVACDDGKGYDFYRVAWQPTWHWWSTNVLSTNWFKSPGREWHGGDLRGWLTMTRDGDTPTRLSVCGHRPGVATPAPADCYDDPWGMAGSIVKSDHAMATVATSPSVADVPFF